MGSLTHVASLVDTRPATTAATVAGLPTAIASILIALDWWNPDDAELVAVTGAMAVIIGILGKFVASVVYCRQTVTDLLGPGGTTPPRVDPGPPPPPPVDQPPQTTHPPILTDAVGDEKLGATPADLEDYMRRHPAPFPPMPPPPPPPPPP